LEEFLKEEELVSKQQEQEQVVEQENDEPEPGGDKQECNSYLLHPSFIYPFFISEDYFKRFAYVLLLK
jgi:hypothetical protein